MLNRRILSQYSQRRNGTAFEREQYINSVNLNNHTDFPYLVLDVINDNSYPRNPGFQVVYRHEDLQFIYVMDGMIELRTLDDTVQIQAGEVILINKNVVHDVRRIESCHYNSFIFPAYFLEFYSGSPAKAFVDSIAGNKNFPIFISLCLIVGMEICLPYYNS